MKRLGQDAKTNLLLFTGCWLMYALTCFTKSNYTASVAYIVSQGIFDKVNSGTIASAFYLFYGVGQILGGYLVDKHSPYRLITVSCIGALLTNLALCFTTDYIPVLIIWSISGISQFAIWPGVCHIIATDILPRYRERACVFLQYGLPLASLGSYLFSFLVLENFGWVAMFASSTVSMVAALVFWLCVQHHRPENVKRGDKAHVLRRRDQHKKREGFLPLLISSGVIFLLFVSMGTTLLNNGAQVWIPTMIMESYSVSSGMASMQTLFLLGVQIIGLLLLNPLFKKVKNPFVGEIMCYGLCLIPLIALQFVGQMPLPLVLAMLGAMILITRVWAVFSMEVGLLFGKYGYSGTYSGIGNSLASFGIVIASTGYGLLSHQFGWAAVTISWLVIGVMCLACCVPVLFLGKKLLKKNED